MGFAVITDVRNIGRLPDSTKIADPVIAPHLEAGQRELENLIGDYGDLVGNDRDDCLMAECCFCMANLLPVLNTFYTQGLSTLQKELGEIDFLFHSPSDMMDMIKYWKERGKNSVSDLIVINKDNKPKIRFCAI